MKKWNDRRAIKPIQIYVHKWRKKHVDSFSEDTNNKIENAKAIGYTCCFWVRQQHIIKRSNRERRYFFLLIHSKRKSPTEINHIFKKILEQFIKRNQY